MENDQLIADFMAETEKSPYRSPMRRVESRKISMDSVNDSSTQQSGKKRKLKRTPAGKSLVMEKLKSNGGKSANTIMVRFANSKFVKQI